MEPPSSLKAEAPRQVYLTACRQICEALEPEGFRYKRSPHPHALRFDDDHICSISFQSSRYNMAGEYVALWIHAGVQSSPMEQWLRDSPWPFQRAGRLGGGQIGNLKKPTRWLEWNLADPETRSATLDAALRCIREVALPFFEQFSDLPALAKMLLHADVMGIEAEEAIGLCFWQLGSAAAEQCLTRYVRRSSMWVDNFRRERDRILAGGIPEDVIGEIEAPRLGAIAASLRIATEL